jgi:hypothetical protein
VPSDVAAGGAGHGNGNAGLDGDLVGVGPDGDLNGLPGVGQLSRGGRPSVPLGVISWMAAPTGSST